MQNIEAEYVTHVAVAIILNPSGQVLLSQRSADVHQANLWEYPGGKVQAGETASDALIREIHEELGLDIQQATPVMRIPYDYPDRRVLLDVWRVDVFKGNPVGREGQPIQWCHPCNLEMLPFPEANKSITEMMKLPPVYGITPYVKTDTERFLSKLDSVLKKGLRLIQIREPELNQSELERFTDQVLARCSKFNARVLVNSDPEHALRMGVHGVHLSSDRLMRLSENPLDDRLMVAASCHNTRELNKAEIIGADFVVLSPVKQTSSHTDAVPLGWTQFRKLATTCNLPVYALGGMNEDDIKQAQLAGAIGVAMLSGLW